MMFRNRESRGELMKLEQEKWVYRGKAETFQLGKQLDIGSKGGRVKGAGDWDVTNRIRRLVLQVT